jgi:hypothetical protein
MRLIALAAAVLLFGASAQAQWGVTMGPGVNPELTSWYSTWTTVQNGQLVRGYTPANVGQCRLELLAIVQAYPPTASPEGTPFRDRWVIYHPAYTEAKHVLAWMHMWPAYRP